MSNKNLAIITARSGSKGLIDKNIKLLNGKPLFWYSVNSAKESGLFSEIIVSTDSKKYAEIARGYGVSIPFLRGKANSSDNASSWDVVREVLENYKGLGRTFDTVCLLQPTSPLRTSDDIVGAYHLFNEKEATTVIGVCETEHSPLWENTLGESLSMDNFIRTDKDRRQLLDIYYRINGAIYIIQSDYIMNSDNIYSNSFAYIMPRERSVDIDTELDFIIAETIMKYSG